MAFLSQSQTIPSAGPPNPLTTPTKQFKEWTTSEEIRKWKTKHNFLLSVDLLHTNTHTQNTFPSRWCDTGLMLAVHLHNEDTTFLLSWLLLLCINDPFPTPLTFRKTHNLKSLICNFFIFFSFMIPDVRTPEKCRQGRLHGTDNLHALHSPSVHTWINNCKREWKKRRGQLGKSRRRNSWEAAFLGRLKKYGSWKHWEGSWRLCYSHNISDI